MSGRHAPAWLETADGRRLGLALIGRVWTVELAGGKTLALAADPAPDAVTGLQLLRCLTAWAIEVQRQAPTLAGKALVGTMCRAHEREIRRRGWTVEPTPALPVIGTEATAEQLILLLVIVYGQAARVAPDTADSDRRPLIELRDLLAEALVAEQRRGKAIARREGRS